MLLIECLSDTDAVAAQFPAHRQGQHTIDATKHQHHGQDDRGIDPQQPCEQAHRHNRRGDQLQQRIQSAHGELDLGAGGRDHRAAVALHMDAIGLIQRAPIGLTAEIRAHRYSESAVQPQIQQPHTGCQYRHQGKHQGDRHDQQRLVGLLDPHLGRQ